LGKGAGRRDRKFDRSDVERLGQQILRIAGQPLRYAGQVALIDDFAPADALGERAISESERDRTITARRGQSSAVLAHQAHRR
jgi:hypothetical protein